MKRAFDALDTRYGAARADLLRYLVLYARGGVYLDAKSSAVRLDELTHTDKLLTSYWPVSSCFVDSWHFCGLVFLPGFPWRGELQQYWIASPPRNPALRNVIERCVWQIEAAMNDRRRGAHGKWSVWTVTGPILYTYALREQADAINILGPHGGGRMTYMHVNHRQVQGRRHYFNHAHNLVR